MPPLVFLHGGLHGSWCWKPFLTAAAGTDPELFSQTLCLDMPGCGLKRSRDPSGETLSSIVAELNSDIKKAGLKNVILIGHSIAGAVLPQMAAADPSLFTHLIYISTSTPLEGQSINQMMGTSVHGTKEDEVGFPLDPLTTPQAELAMAMFSPGLDGEQLAWLMGEVAQDKTPPAVAGEGVNRAGYEAWGGKRTYVLTKKDPILPVKWQRVFAQRVGCTEVVEIDTPHEPFVSHPAVLVEALRGILQR